MFDQDHPLLVTFPYGQFIWELVLHSLLNMTSHSQQPTTPPNGGIEYVAGTQALSSSPGWVHH